MNQPISEKRTMKISNVFDMREFADLGAGQMRISISPRMKNLQRIAFSIITCYPKFHVAKVLTKVSGEIEFLRKILQ